MQTCSVLDLIGNTRLVDLKKATGFNIEFLSFFSTGGLSWQNYIFGIQQ